MFFSMKWTFTAFNPGFSHERCADHTLVISFFLALSDVPVCCKYGESLWFCITWFPKKALLMMKVKVMMRIIGVADDMS